MKVFEPYPGIKVYDDVFSWDCQNKIFEQLYKDTNYFIGWGDHFASSDKFLYSSHNAEDWEIMLTNGTPEHWMNRIAKSEPFLEFSNRELVRSMINLTTIADTNEAHNHPNEDVLLYYVNTEWKPHWQGETFFYDSKVKKVVYTSPYIPNRMIKFDGHIIHRFNTQSRSAPKFRFSISTFFLKEEVSEKGFSTNQLPTDLKGLI